MIASIAVLAFGVAAAKSEAPDNHHAIAPPRPVSALVSPVLNAYDAVAAKDDESAELPLNSALHKVLEAKTGYGDEALAILLGYYIGEASGEDVSCELVSRGRYVLFYIDKYAKVEPVITGVHSRHARVFDEYAIVRHRIMSGEVCHVEK